MTNLCRRGQWVDQVGPASSRRGGRTRRHQLAQRCQAHHSSSKPISWSPSVNWPLYVSLSAGAPWPAVDQSWPVGSCLTITCPLTLPFSPQLGFPQIVFPPITIFPEKMLIWYLSPFRFLDLGWNMCSSVDPNIYLLVWQTQICVHSIQMTNCPIAIAFKYCAYLRDWPVGSGEK